MSREFQDREVDTLLNPTVIFEVLSESTEAYDRGVKFGHYRRIPSLREYVLVSQDRMLVERYTRQGDDWLLSEFTRPDQSLRLESIDCTIPLDRIYAKVKFDQTTRLLRTSPALYVLLLTPFRARRPTSPVNWR